MNCVTLPTWQVGDTVNDSYVDEWEKTGFIFIEVGRIWTSSVNTEKRVNVVYNLISIF